MTREQRSFTMSRIRSRDTGPEIKLRRTLRRNGATGYRVHPKGVDGTPDIAFMRKKVAVFVDGCFWHICPICYREPSSNTGFWRVKASRNVERDQRVEKLLKDRGWKVMRIWEHEVDADPDSAAQSVLALLVDSCD